MIASNSWSGLIVSSRDHPAVLLTTIRAAQRAARDDTIIDVVVNGNRHLAQHVRHALGSRPSNASAPRVRLHTIDVGDKANAYNQFIHSIWPQGRHIMFMDGYAFPRPDAFQLLSAALEESPSHLAAAAVPTCGWGARRLRTGMERHGGLHGNLFALAAPAAGAMRARGIHLPLGLYRIDGLLGGMLAFRFDQHAHRWDPKGSIRLVPSASWTLPGRLRWHPASLVDHIQRRYRQARGAFENHALEYLLAGKKVAPEALPRSVGELVRLWAAEQPAQLQNVMREGGRRLARAYSELTVPRDWSKSDLAACLLDEFQPG